MLPAVAENVTEVALAGTVTGWLGTGNRLLLLASPTTTPPLGAVLLKVTVHVVVAPESRLAGLHVSDDTTIDGVRRTVNVCDAPFRLAVRVAL